MIRLLSASKRKTSNCVDAPGCCRHVPPVWRIALAIVISLRAFATMTSLSYSQLLDRFPADLSYFLHLLICFGCVEVDHGGRFAAMGGVGPLVVVEGDPAADACLGL